MKNRILTLTAALIASLFLNIVVATAQTAPTGTSAIQATLPPPPKKLPIASASEMQAFAEGLVNKLYLSNYNNSASGKTMEEVDYTAGDIDTAKMSAKIQGIQLDYRADPTKMIDVDVTYGWRTADQKSQFSLFFGNTKFNLVQNSGTGLWEIPASAYRISIQSLNWVPVSIFGIQNAWSETTDAKGNVVSSYSFDYNGRVDPNNNFLMLGAEFAGRPDTTIYVTLSNQTRLVYGPDGTLQAVVPVSAKGFIPSIVGDRTLADNTSNLAFQAGDKLVRIKFTSNVAGTITFPPVIAGNLVPLAAFYVDSAAYWANPEMRWTEINLKVPTYNGVAGKLMIFRFDYKNTDPQPSNSGKGN